MFEALAIRSNRGALITALCLGQWAYSVPESKVIP
jgi:hypothetical protein